MSSFRYIAYDDERPLFLGTLAWSDYTEHYGINGAVNNIRSLISDNQTQIDNILTNANIFSVGNMEIDNCDFKNISKHYGYNVHAGQLVFIPRSRLETKSINGAAVNIFGGTLLSVFKSTLKARGLNDSSNYRDEVNIGSDVDFTNSNLLLEIGDEKEEECDRCVHFGSIEAHGYIALSNTQVRIKDKGRAGQCYFPVGALSSQVMFAHDVPLPLHHFSGSKIEIINSTIDVFSESSSSYGVLNEDGDIYLENSKITVRAKDSAEIFSNSWKSIHIIFEGDPSTLSVAHSTMALLNKVINKTLI